MFGDARIFTVISVHAFPDRERESEFFTARLRFVVVLPSWSWLRNVR